MPRKSNAQRQKEYRERHPERYKESQRKWREKNKQYNRDRQRPYHLKYRYGMSVGEYDALFKQQNGQCAICGTTEPTGKWNVLAVDHCHHTGDVRGLLCNECNRGMGLLGDDASLLRAAADYLDDHKKITLAERQKP